MEKTFLPSIHNGPAVTGEGNLDKARQVFERMKAHPEQGRVGMVWNDKLAYAAMDKCETQASEGWTGHVDFDGRGPNWWARRHGYHLPDWYSDDLDANNIESLSHNGDGSVEGVWRAWMASEGHRVHILALNSFYAQQTQVGVGYYEGGEKRFYWCILSAPPSEG